MTSAEILLALRRHHGIIRDHPMNAEPWAFLEEFTIGTAFRCASRIDALVIQTGRPHTRIAYEVKVSRSDLVSELKNPYKRRNAELITNRWVLATPPGLVRGLEELPDNAGLVEIWPQGVKWLAEGITRECESPDYFVASLARRASRAEEKIRQSKSVEVQNRLFEEFVESQLIKEKE